jgi:DNA-directed RNA polymerase specialized sigma24 family protein
VQEAWIRLSRADTSDVQNIGGWLTTVVARVCLDMLRSRESRYEEPVGAVVPEPPEPGEDGLDPERQALLGDSVGLALLVVLETLTPAERVAFVLHDLFGVPFEDIAPIVERSTTATRQLASRARRRVRGAAPPHDADRSRRQQVVDAFLAASRRGDFGALLRMLDPDVVVRADGTAVEMGALREVRGAAAVAETFAGRARAARPALIDEAPGLVWTSGGEARMVFGFTIEDDRIVAIDLVADPDRISRFDLAVRTG